MFQGITSHTSANMQVRPNGTMLESGNMIAVPVWFTAKTETTSMVLGGLDLFEVKEGKILHGWTFSDHQSEDDVFFGK